MWVRWNCTAFTLTKQTPTPPDGCSSHPPPAAPPPTPARSTGSDRTYCASPGPTYTHPTPVSTAAHTAAPPTPPTAPAPPPNSSCGKNSSASSNRPTLHQRILVGVPPRPEPRLVRPSLGRIPTTGSNARNTPYIITTRRRATCAAANARRHHHQLVIPTTSRRRPCTSSAATHSPEPPALTPLANSRQRPRSSARWPAVTSRSGPGGIASMSRAEASDIATSPASPHEVDSSAAGAQSLALLPALASAGWPATGPTPPPALTSASPSPTRRPWTTPSTSTASTRSRPPDGSWTSIPTTSAGGSAERS